MMTLPSEIKADVFGQRYHDRIATQRTTKDERCAMCGRGIERMAPSTRWIHYTTSGTITSLNDHPQSQGMFTIGPECAKTLPGRFTWRWTVKNGAAMFVKGGTA